MEQTKIREQIEQELTAALKMVVDSFTHIGFEDFYILGKVNCILEGFIDDNGEFTPEYIALAKKAIDTRASDEFKNSLGIETQPAQDGGVGLILPSGIGGK